MILGASFDSEEDQKTFATNENFPYQLLSDPDRAVGRQYDAERAEGEPFAEYGLPRRISYLIRPGGEIAKAYDLNNAEDLSVHAAEVLGDIAALG